MTQPRSKGHVGRPWRRLREQVLAQSNICWICGNPGATTVDHIIPVSLGGPPLDPDNVKPAHLTCNSARGNGRRGMPTSRPW
jgi:5-methylcytosine-specific restriction endonuclease McrA